MPIHDWSRAEASTFHTFRHRWIGALVDALHSGQMPEDHFAAIEPARTSDRIAVHHRDGRIVSVIEIVAPADKASSAALNALVESISRAITGRVHVLLVDLFPPGAHDPSGVLHAVWLALGEEIDEPPADRPLMAASIDSGPIPASYAEPIAIGEILPEMPVFLEPSVYIPAPLEASYQSAWDALPEALKARIGGPSSNGGDADSGWAARG